MPSDHSRTVSARPTQHAWKNWRQYAHGRIQTFMDGAALVTSTHGTERVFTAVTPATRLHLSRTVPGDIWRRRAELLHVLLWPIKVHQ